MESRHCVFRLVPLAAPQHWTGCARHDELRCFIWIEEPSQASDYEVAMNKQASKLISLFLWTTPLHIELISSLFYLK